MDRSSPRYAQRSVIEHDPSQLPDRNFGSVVPDENAFSKGQTWPKEKTSPLDELFFQSGYRSGTPQRISSRTGSNLPGKVEGSPPKDWKIETEYYPYYAAYQEAPNPRTTQDLLQKLQPTISKAVRTYGGDPNDPVLKARAKVLTIEALRKYNPKQAKLSSYLLTHLQALRRYSAKRNMVVSIPERLAIERQMLHKKEQELEDNFGREPTDEELADALGVSLRRIQKIRSLPSVVAESTLVQSNSEDEDGGAFDPEVVDLQQSGKTAWRQVVYNSLGPQDKLIMEHTLGLNGKKVLSGNQLASKLGVSEAFISQRKQKIQEMLNDPKSLEFI